MWRDVPLTKGTVISSHFVWKIAGYIHWIDCGLTVAELSEDCEEKNTASFTYPFNGAMSMGSCRSLSLPTHSVYFGFCHLLARASTLPAHTPDATNTSCL